MYFLGFSDVLNAVATVTNHTNHSGNSTAHWFRHDEIVVGCDRVATQNSYVCIKIGKLFEVTRRSVTRALLRYEAKCAKTIFYSLRVEHCIFPHFWTRACGSYLARGMRVLCSAVLNTVDTPI